MASKAKTPAPAAVAVAAAAPHVDPATISRACTALLQHLRKTAQSTLFEDSSAIFLEFRLKRMPGHELTKPVQMCVPPPHWPLFPPLPPPLTRAPNSSSALPQPRAALAAQP